MTPERVSQKTMGPVNAKTVNAKTGVSRDRTKVMPHVAYSDLLSHIYLVNLPSVDVRTVKSREKSLVHFRDLS